MQRTICLYCGARTGNNPLYAEVAAELGAALADSGWCLVYGGGGVGLMGIAARAALAAGGNVIGVIPRALFEREQGLDAVSELVVTETLRERKAIMFERSDAFIAMPGGFGTLEELVETLTLRQLRYHNRPIYLLNSAGFYDPLLAFFQHAVANGFIHSTHLDLIEVYPHPAALLAALNEHFERLEQAS